MEPGYGIGFLVAIFICGAITVWALYEKRKIENRIRSILKDIPQDISDQLENTGYEVCSDNANFMYGCSYIYEIKQKDGGVDVFLMYYMPPQDPKALPYTPDRLFLNQNDYEKNKDIVKEGVLVKTVHNRTNACYKVCRIEFAR